MDLFFCIIKARRKGKQKGSAQGTGGLHSGSRRHSSCFLGVSGGFAHCNDQFNLNKKPWDYVDGGLEGQDGAAADNFNIKLSGVRGLRCKSENAPYRCLFRCTFGYNFRNSASFKIYSFKAGRINLSAGSHSSVSKVSGVTHLESSCSRISRFPLTTWQRKQCMIRWNPG